MRRSSRWRSFPCSPAFAFWRCSAMSLTFVSLVCQPPALSLNNARMQHKSASDRRRLVVQHVLMGLLDALPLRVRRFYSWVIKPEARWVRWQGWLR